MKKLDKTFFIEWLERLGEREKKHNLASSVVVTNPFVLGPVHTPSKKILAFGTVC